MTRAWYIKMILAILVLLFVIFVVKPIMLDGVFPPEEEEFEWQF